MTLDKSALFEHNMNLNPNISLTVCHNMTGGQTILKQKYQNQVTEKHTVLWKESQTDQNQNSSLSFQFIMPQL